MAFALKEDEPKGIVRYVSFESLTDFFVRMFSFLLGRLLPASVFKFLGNGNSKVRKTKYGKLLYELFSAITWSLNKRYKIVLKKK